jgi:hypothetical protein
MVERPILLLPPVASIAAGRSVHAKVLPTETQPGSICPLHVIGRERLTILVEVEVGDLKIAAHVLYEFGKLSGSFFDESA